MKLRLAASSSSQTVLQRMAARPSAKRPTSRTRDPAKRASSSAASRAMSSGLVRRLATACRLDDARFELDLDAADPTRDEVVDGPDDQTVDEAGDKAPDAVDDREEHNT